MNLKICIAGAIASGKTTICDIITQTLECERFSFSDVLKNELQSSHLSNTRENLQNLGISIIKEKGSEGFMKWIIENSKINIEGRNILIDGFRHPKIFLAFKKLYPQALLIFCDCSLEEQMKRIGIRDNISPQDAFNIISHPVEKEVSMLKQFADVIFDENVTRKDIEKWIKEKINFSKKNVGYTKKINFDKANHFYERE